jgi:hypothetical protein
MMFTMRRHGWATALSLSFLVAASSIAGAQDMTRELGASARTKPSGQDTAIGLQARFDRADPSYAVGEQLRLTVTTRRAAYIEIWELGPDGAFDKIVPARGTPPISQPGKPLRLPAPGMSFEVGPPRGVSELHVIARAVDGTQRSIGDADTKVSGTATRDEVRLRYTIL